MGGGWRVQTVVKQRSNSGQTAVKKNGQIAVKQWSNSGQKRRVKAREAAAAPRRAAATARGRNSRINGAPVVKHCGQMVK